MRFQAVNYLYPFVLSKIEGRKTTALLHKYSTTLSKIISYIYRIGDNLST